MAPLPKTHHNFATGRLFFLRYYVCRYSYICNWFKGIVIVVLCTLFPIQSSVKNCLLKLKNKEQFPKALTRLCQKYSAYSENCQTKITTKVQ